ncbi:MAG TPA: hypothetical protein VFA68_10980 [Terriglobales bacterium]|nr:hypothetical protein [Terriglobales bacterium]
MMEEIPIACGLSDEELRIRETTLLERFKSHVIATRELADGYSFELHGDREVLAMVAEMMAAERECCPFLRFQLTAEPRMGALQLFVTGPFGAKAFLKAHFVES